MPGGKILELARRTWTAGRLQDPKTKFRQYFRFSQLIHRVVGVVGSPVVGRSIEGDARNYVSVSKGRLAVVAVRVVDFLFQKRIGLFAEESDWIVDESSRESRRLVPALFFAGQTAVAVVRETGKQILLPGNTQTNQLAHRIVAMDQGQ